MYTSESNLGYEFQECKNKIVIRRYGKQIMILKDEKADEFLALINQSSDDEIQMELARITGNYKRGNERLAKSHPRNKDY